MSLVDLPDEPLFSGFATCVLPEPNVHPNSRPLLRFSKVILLVATVEVVVWSYLVNLVNVSSLYWQETFARRCLSLRLTWFRCLFWCGVTFAQHVFGHVSRIERRGLWVSLAIDWELAVSLERRSSRRGGVGAIILVTAEVCVSFPQSQRARLA